MIHTNKNSICFIGLDCYPVLSESSGNDYIGGESVQISLLAKEFSQSGFKVSVICGDYGQPDIEIIKGIRLIKAFKKGPGIPVLRFLHRRIYCFLKALKKANSDIYYQSCSGFITGLVALHCNLSKKDKTFIFRVASDADCIPSEHISTNYWQRILYQYGLKKADIIAVQGVKQQALLKNHYNLSSLPVNMIAEEPLKDITNTKNIDILWIGNIRKVKRPEIVFKLAELLPEYKFSIIGGPLPGEALYYNKIKKEAGTIPNIDFKGFVPYSKVNSFFENAKVLVNTSKIEGFPNTFLQAWARKVPVISFFDPDDLIKNKKLGASPLDTNEMQSIIKHFLSNKNELEKTGLRCESFVRQHYSAPAVTRKYISILEGETTYDSSI